MMPQSGITKTWLSICFAPALLATACAVQGTAASPRVEPRPAVLTVPQISDMIGQGTMPNVVMGTIQESGTVYRLMPGQATKLREDGVPASLVSFMQLTYAHAVEQNPALGKSDAKWTRVDGYWYGGSPYGWPREWVVGGPSLGEAARRR